jgi:hypothetical protein
MEAHYKISSKLEQVKKKLIVKFDMTELLARIRSEEPVEEKLEIIRREEKKAMSLGDDIQTLGNWLRADVLSIYGPSAATRRELYDFIVTELKSRESQCPDKIREVRVALENQKADLLRFAGKIEEELKAIAEKWQMPERLACELLEMSQFEPEHPRHWDMDALLWKRYGQRSSEVRDDLETLAEGIVRASSMVENLNSRLRNYFELRKILKGDYLELLRFYLNNRRYPRSRVTERKNKSPAEILRGCELPTWLEQLGFNKNSRAA